MPDEVFGEGSPEAKVAVFAQAPGADEMIAGRPLVGRAGRMYDQVLHNTKLLRSQLWTDNMAKRQPPKNNISVYFKGRAPGGKGSGPITPTPQLEHWIEQNRQKVRELRPNVIVPMGAEALWMVTGMGNIGDISKWRGSIIESWDYFVPGLKVVPAYHPAHVLRNIKLQPLLEADLRRAGMEGESPELDLPDPLFHLNPSLEDVIEYIKLCIESEWLSCDIETRYSHPITVGIGHSVDEAMCIPFTESGQDRWELGEEILIWRWLSKLLANHTGLVGQGFHYDAAILARWIRITTQLPRLDTMAAWHECYPALPKDLGTITSVLTRFPYYKDDKKDWIGKINDEKLRRYNCLDVASTLTAALKLDKELDYWGARHSYDFQMESLFKPLTRATVYGLPCNENAKDELTEKYRQMMHEHQQRLDKAAGEHVNVKSPKFKNLLYIQLNLPTRYDKDTKALTTSKKALYSIKSELRNRRPDDYRIQLVDDGIKVSELRKLIESYSNVKLDQWDGRLRFAYNVSGTETWRTTCTKSIFGGGFSMQTAPVRTREGKEIRKLVKPDPGKRLCNMDLARAEAMVVFWLANEITMINKCLRGEDTHWYCAKIIADAMGYEGVTMDTIYDPTSFDHYNLRFAGKQTSHATHYKMGPRTMREHLLAVNLDIPEKTCKAVQASYRIKRPAIPQWHLETEYTIRRTKTLTTPAVNGVVKKRVFRGSPQDQGAWDDMVREGLAFVPQCTVGVILHTILGRVWNEYCHKGLDILQESHDSFLFQIPEDWDPTQVFHKIDEMGHLPMTINGRELIIPREFETGPSWGELEEVEL